MQIRVDDPELVAGIVTARAMTIAPAPADLAQRLDELVGRRATEDFPPPPVKDAVRRLLRHGGFKPAGRNKPASEYLAQAAREGRFPRINNVVDINNLLSLESGLPISLLDLDVVGENAEIRYGREGEKYVFNPAGQELDLAGLLCVCRVESAASTPLGTPVKDSMAGKVKEQTRSVVGVIYGSTGVLDPAAMLRLAEEFGRLLRACAGAAEVDQRVLRG